MSMLLKDLPATIIVCSWALLVIGSLISGIVTRQRYTYKRPLKRLLASFGEEY